MLRQTSPEAEGIFDFILELHKACNGQWNTFCYGGIEQEHLDTWLEFAGMFLSSVGNHFEPVTKEEVEAVTKMMEAKKISPENTRLQKRAHGDVSSPQDFDAFEILQRRTSRPNFLETSRSKAGA
ncbi:hypothetical protein QQX98_005404 [Neonectria punicea]|uniref:Uncharacterized protein n=1 Tax=Neonectria punicea TaxID=979145 RepID=A0ABR1H6G2_9HYPO